MNAHADDLELARRCAAGDEQAWERFVLEYRPVLYRAADALVPGGGARDMADALYADLYGMQERDGERRSLFRYFEGRSSLATWLRAVLAQRHVDRLREQRRLVPLADSAHGGASGGGSGVHEAIGGPKQVPARGAHPRLSASGLHDEGAGDPAMDADRARYQEMMQQALAAAVARLAPRDRLRLGCYYVQQLTLAETGRLLREHEATVSRQLARTRRAIRTAVEQELRDSRGLNEAQIAECFASISEDVGALDLESMFDSAERKKSPADRSV